MLRESAGHRIFRTAELLEEVVRHTDRKSVLNVMTTCWHGFRVAYPEYYRNGSVNMLVTFGRSWCPPSRSAMYCEAVRLLTAPSAFTQERLMYLSKIFPNAKTITGGTSNVYSRSKFTLVRPTTQVEPVFDYKFETHFPASVEIEDLDWETIRYVTYTYKSKSDTRSPLEQFIPFLRTTPQLHSKLKSLHLPFAILNVNDGSLTSFLSLCSRDAPRLRHLDIAVNVVVTSVILSVARQFPQLQRLALSTGNTYPDTSSSLDDLLEATAKHLLHLRRLSLQIHNTWIDQSLQSNSLTPQSKPYLPRLEKLKLLVHSVPRSHLRMLLILSKFVSSVCQVTLASPPIDDHYGQEDIGNELAVWTSQLSADRAIMSAMHPMDETKKGEKQWTQLPSTKSPSPAVHPHPKRRSRSKKGRFTGRSKA